MAKARILNDSTQKNEAILHGRTFSLELTRDELMFVAVICGKILTTLQHNGEIYDAIKELVSYGHLLDLPEYREMSARFKKGFIQF